jgi:hypothetical protein
MLVFGDANNGESLFFVPIDTVPIDAVQWDMTAFEVDEQTRLAWRAISELGVFGHGIEERIVTFALQTGDDIPIYDMLDRQWKRFRMRITQYAADKGGLMSGVDKPSHVTTYTVPKADFPAILADFAQGISIEPEIAWLFGAASMDDAALAEYNALFAAWADYVRTFTSSDLKMTLLFDEFDAITGMTGSVTLKPADGKSVSVSTTYKKKSSKTSVTRNLTLRASTSSATVLDVSVKNTEKTAGNGNNAKTEIVFIADISATLGGVKYRLSIDSKQTASPASGDSGTAAAKLSVGGETRYSLTYKLTPDGVMNLSLWAAEGAANPLSPHIVGGVLSFAPLPATDIAVSAAISVSDGGQPALPLDKARNLLTLAP